MAYLFNGSKTNFCSLTGDMVEHRLVLFPPKPIHGHGWIQIEFTRNNTFLCDFFLQYALRHFYSHLIVLVHWLFMLFHAIHCNSLLFLFDQRVFCAISQNLGFSDKKHYPSRCFADFFSSHPFALPATAAALQVLPQTHYFWIIILFINMGHLTKLCFLVTPSFGVGWCGVE